MGAALTAATVMREAATGAATLGTVTYMTSITLQFSSFLSHIYISKSGISDYQNRTRSIIEPQNYEMY
jgi:hypothetical protein